MTLHDAHAAASIAPPDNAFPRKRTARTLLTILALCGLFLTARPSQAVQFLDMTSNSGVGYFCGSGCTFGYDFTLTTTETVAALGLWDHDADGLNSAHQVGLWNSSQVLLASTTIDNGSIALDNGFGQPGGWLFENISAISIDPGQYYIGMLQTAEPSSNQDLYMRGNLTLNVTGSTFGVSRFGGFGDPANLTFPNTASNGGNGPNWSTTTVVPEPSTALLMGFGLAGLGAVGKRK